MSSFKVRRFHGLAALNFAVSRIVSETRVLHDRFRAHEKNTVKLRLDDDICVLNT